jgi:subtilisin-like proprotein convertase family protein
VTGPRGTTGATGPGGSGGSGARLAFVYPFSGFAGRAVEVVVLGIDTAFDATTRADFGAGVPVAALTVLAPSTLIVTLRVHALAPPGPRDVTVTTGPLEAPQTLTLSGAFRVDAALSAEVTGVQAQGGLLRVGVVNHDPDLPFLPGPTLPTGEVPLAGSASLGDGVVILSQTFLSTAEAVFTAQIETHAAPGARHLLVSNPDGRTRGRPDVLLVRATVPVPVASGGIAATTIDAPLGFALFALDAAQHAVVAVSLTPGASLTPRLTLFGGGHDTVRDPLGSFDGTTLAFAAPAAGTYLVHVADAGGGGGPAGYDVTLAATMTMTHRVITEPEDASTGPGVNDTRATATLALPPGGTGAPGCDVDPVGCEFPIVLRGALTPSLAAALTPDVDYFAFALPAQAVVKAAFGPDGAGTRPPRGVSLRLEDAAGAVMRSAQGAGFVGFDWVSPAAGTYHLRVARGASSPLEEAGAWLVAFTAEAFAPQEFAATDVPLPVPDARPDTPAVSVVDVPLACVVAFAQADVWVNHTFRGDLEAYLAHGPVSVVLHRRTGGSGELRAVYGLDTQPAFGRMEDFAGRDAQGPWVLTVADVAPADAGTLERFVLRLLCAP